jgi:hypothetical protein
VTDLELLDVLEVLLDVDGGCSTCAKDAIGDLVRKMELDRELVAQALEVIYESAGRATAKHLSEWVRTAKHLDPPPPAPPE